MTDHNDLVASSDIIKHIQAITKWVEGLVDEGWVAYQITFMFRLSSDRPPSRLSSEMESALNQFYGTFLKRCMRNPNSERNRSQRPMMIVCPDFPVYKRARSHMARFLPHNGVHYGGILLVIDVERLETGVIEHFKQHHHRYCFRGSMISRIHAQRIEKTLHSAVDYVLKSLKSRRSSIDDIIIFPKSSTE